MITALPHRKSGLFRHMYADQTVCFQEARDPGTGACVSRCKGTITGQSTTFSLLLHFATLRSFYSQLSHRAGLFKRCTSSKRVVEVPADLAGGVHRDERAHQDVRRL